MPNGRCDNGSWLEVFKIASGISSFGGFLGAAIGLVTFFRLRRIVVIPRLFELVGGKGRPVLRYLDSLAYGFSVGWFFGRMGCFTAHDHVGKPSSAWLAVNFPDGWRAGVPAVPGFGAEGFTPRFDLGFLEMLWAGAMFLFFHFWALKQKDLRPGWYAAVFIIAYAPIRFYLDTLRAIDIEGADKRYFSDLVQPGITPGQIGAVIVLLLGLAIWVAGGRRRHDEAYRSHTETDDVTESLRA
jgi:phosphatidylglycerol:prolipoprotein diacylglycerol transferase